MKQLLSFLLIPLCFLPMSAQEFEGVIKYQLSFESPIDQISEPDYYQNLIKQYGSEQTIYYSEGKYVLRRNDALNTVIIFNSSKNKCVQLWEKERAFSLVAIGDQEGSIEDLGSLRKKERIQGRKCNGHRFQHSDVSVEVFYDPDLEVRSAYFENHRKDFLDAHIGVAESLPLKWTYSFPDGLIITYEAVVIHRRQFKESYFEVPSNFEIRQEPMLVEVADEVSKESGELELTLVSDENASYPPDEPVIQEMEIQAEKKVAKEQILVEKHLKEVEEEAIKVLEKSKEDVQEMEEKPFVATQKSAEMEQDEIPTAFVAKEASLSEKVAPVKKTMSPTAKAPVQLQLTDLKAEAVREHFTVEIPKFLLEDEDKRNALSNVYENPEYGMTVEVVQESREFLNRIGFTDYNFDDHLLFTQDRIRRYLSNVEVMHRDEIIVDDLRMRPMHISGDFEDGTRVHFVVALYESATHFYQVNVISTEDRFAVSEAVLKRISTSLKEN